MALALLAMAPAKTTLGVRLDEALVARVEEHRLKMLASMPEGVPLTTSDVIRVLLMKALDAEDGPEPKASKPTPKASKPKPRKA